MKQGLKVVLLMAVFVGLINCHKSSSTSTPSASGLPNFTNSYVIDHSGNVYLCSIGTNGKMSSCTVSNGGTTFTQPYGIALNLINPMVYVTDLAAGNVYLCAVDTSTLQLLSCTVSNGGASGWKPMGISTAIINGAQVVYVVDNRSGTGNIYICSSDNTTGLLSGCAQSNGGVSWVDPARITFGVVNNQPYAYVSDSGAHNIYLCALNSSTGALTSCAVTNGGESGWDPGGILAGSFNGSAFYAYVTDGTHGNVYLCSVAASTGNLSSCAVSNGGVSGWAPSNIAISIENGAYFLDVTDQNGNVYVCSVNTGTGALSSCAISNGGATFSQPAALLSF